jgi:hypothetical protein
MRKDLRERIKIERGDREGRGLLSDAYAYLEK